MASSLGKLINKEPESSSSSNHSIGDKVDTTNGTGAIRGRPQMSKSPAKDVDTAPTIPVKDFASVPSPGCDLRSAGDLNPSPSLLNRYIKRSPMLFRALTLAKTSPTKSTTSDIAPARITAAFTEDFDQTASSNREDASAPAENRTSGMRTPEGIDFTLLPSRKPSPGTPPSTFGRSGGQSEDSKGRSEPTWPGRTDSHGSVKANVSAIGPDKDGDSKVKPPKALIIHKTQHASASKTDSPKRLPPTPPVPTIPPPVVAKDHPKLNLSHPVTTTFIPKRFPPIPIDPPNYAVLLKSQNGYQWCSNARSCSRPAEPWGRFKFWTCCSCGSNRGERDEVGREVPPAETMAEQKICSRLSCGHERCFQCRMA